MGCCKSTRPYMSERNHGAASTTASQCLCSPLAEAFNASHLGANTEKALAWCSAADVHRAEELLAAESRLSEALGLRVLERKRLLCVLGGNPLTVSFEEIPRPPARRLSQTPEVPNYNLRIRMLTGRVIEITMNGSDNVLVLKMQIRREDGFLQIKQFVLVHDGKELFNKWLLSECGLQRTAELHLVLRQAGDLVIDGLIPLLEEAGVAEFHTEIVSALANFGAVFLHEFCEHATPIVDSVGLMTVEKEKLFSVLASRGFSASEPPTAKPSAALDDTSIQQAVNDVCVGGEHRFKVEIKYGHISCWDTAQVTDMQNLFARKHTFNEDLSAWNVSNVRNMSCMFQDAELFDGDLSAWDVGNVTSMMGMFAFAQSFNGNLSSWNVSNVEDMTCMFGGAASFNGDLSAWDVSGAKDMGHMFNKAKNFNSNLNQWNVDKADTTGMFIGATKSCKHDRPKRSVRALE